MRTERPQPGAPGSAADKHPDRVAGQRPDRRAGSQEQVRVLAIRTPLAQIIDQRVADVGR